MSKTPHITIHQTPPHYTLRCAICDDEHLLHTPCSVDMALAQMEAFGEMHKDCEMEVEQEGEDDD